MMFDLWPVYSGERFRASWPSCFMRNKKNYLSIFVKKIHTASGALSFDDNYGIFFLLFLAHLSRRLRASL